MAIKEVRQFIGINTDTTPQGLPPGDYLDAVDIRIGVTDQGNDLFIETAKGNTSKFSELGFSLPAGTNKCVGRCNDIQNNRLIWLNFNSNGNHGCYCYNSDTNTIQTVLATPQWNFQENIVIHSTDILNNILGFVDGFNRPYSIDVNAALQGQYGSTIIEELITDAKIPPHLPPICTPTYTTGTNFIQSLDSFQFIFRYVFFDGSKSSLSSVSYQIPTGYTGELVEYITLDISTCELFTKPQLQQVVNYVEFAVRDLYTLNFYQFLRVTTQQLVTGVGLPANVWVATGKINYYDTESKTAIDSTEYSMPYSSVPLKANTMNFQDNRKFYGGCTEGYNDFPLVEGTNITGLSQFVLPATSGIPDVSDCDLHINQKYYKGGLSTYGIGLVWQDNYNYKSGVQTLQGMTFTTAPYSGNEVKANGISLTLPFATTSNYPPWATHFMLVRTQNQSAEWFVQGRANNFYYCTGYNSSQVPIYINSTPGPGNANLSDAGTIELHIDLANWTQFGNNMPYVFEAGDKITILTNGGNYTEAVASPQGDSPTIQEYSAPATLTGLNIISQVGSLLKVDYSQAYSFNFNAIANDISGALDNTEGSSENGFPNAMFMVGDNGFISVFGYIPGSFPNPPGYAYPNNPTTNTSPTKSNLYGAAMSGRYNITSPNWQNLILMSGENGELWMNSVTVGIIGGLTNDFDFLTPTWTQLTSGVATTIRCVVYDYDNYLVNGTSIYWACGDNGVILKIANPTANNFTITNFTVTSYSNPALGNLNSICTVLTNQAVCGQNGIIAYFNGTSFVPYSGSATTCNNLNCIIRQRNGTGSYIIAVGDAGTLLINSSGGTAYSDWVIQSSSTAANLYCVIQNIQYDPNHSGGAEYRPNNYNSFTIVGEGNIYLEIDTSVLPVNMPTNLSSNVQLISGDSKSCVYQFAFDNNESITNNDVYVCGSKDVFYGILKNPDIATIYNPFVNLAALSVGSPPVYGILLGTNNDLRLLNILNWGAKIEIYTPVTVSGDVYYEYGDVFPVGQDYTLNLGVRNDGDAFVIKKNFLGSVLKTSGGSTSTVNWAVPGDVIFSMQPSSLNTTGQGKSTPGTDSAGIAISTPAPWDLDWGRLNAILLYPEVQEFRNILRFSDPYVQDSKINGLSSFQQLNYEVIPAGYGPIRKITAVQYVMLINCTKEVATAYINRTIFNQTASNAQVTALSDQVINNVTLLQGGFGCSNPESVVEYMTNVYFYSQVKGMDCRYNNNGDYPISENYYRTFFYKRNNQDLFYCSLHGGFDPKFRQRLLTYNYSFAYTQDTTTIIDTGLQPLVEAYVPTNQFVYALNFGGGTVTPINTLTNSKLPDITVGANPQSAQFADSDNCLYIACAGSDAIYIIDPSTQATTGTPISTTGTLPQALIYYNSALFVVNNSGVVDMIDLNPANVGTYRTVIHSSPALGSNIVSPTLNTDAGEIYVSNINSFSIQALSVTNVSLLATIVLPSSSDAPRGTIYASPVKRLYVCNHGTAVSSVIDVEAGSGTRYDIVKNITLPAAGSWNGVYLNNFVWISGGAGNLLYGIDTTEGFGTLAVKQPVGANPTFIITNPTNNYLFISSANDVVITVYDTVNLAIINNINAGFQSRGLLFSPSNSNVYAAIEGENQVASIGGMITPDTVSYTEGSTEDKKRWGSRYSFIPEMYGWIKNDMFSFLNGELWLHNNNETIANYYGVQYKPTVTTVCNQEPNKVKILQQVQIASNNLWNITSITTPEGQNSELIGLRDYTTAYVPPQDFELLEGMYCASVLRDKNTPNIPGGQLALLSGDLMRSEYFEVTMECQSTEFTILKYVNFYYIYSKATNK